MREKLLKKKSRTLKKGNMPLFELIFWVGSVSSHGIDIAQRISRHIIKKSAAGGTQRRRV